MPSITLFEGSVNDQVTTLGLKVWRELDREDPFVLEFDGDPLRLPIDKAARLALAGRRLERELKSKEPKAGAVFQHNTAFADGTVATFEFGLVDPIAVYLVWHQKRLVLSDYQGGLWLHVLSRIDEAVDDVRRASPPIFPPPPPPGERWKTWSPKLFDPDERPRSWIF